MFKLHLSPGIRPGRVSPCSCVFASSHVGTEVETQAARQVRGLAEFQLRPPVVALVTAPSQQSVGTLEQINPQARMLYHQRFEMFCGGIESLDGPGEARKLTPEVGLLNAVAPEPDFSRAGRTGEERGKDHIVQELAVLSLA